MFPCWAYGYRILWVPRCLKCAPTQIGQEPSSIGWFLWNNSTSYIWFSGETGGLLCPSSLPTILAVDLCCGIVGICEFIGTSLIIGTWMASTDGHTPPIMENVIKFHMGISKVTIAFALINNIDVPIGETYGLDPY